MGDDGAARVELAIESVKVETRFDGTGEHGEWDSTKSKTTDLVGFKRYEALLNRKFGAIVNGDGSIREAKDEAWPKVDVSGMKKGKERDEKAAAATHEPTPALTWLHLIFWTAPQGKEVATRAMRLFEDEKMHMHPDGSETVGKYACSKMQIHSVDKERQVDAGALNLPSTIAHQDFALAYLNATRKRGHSWFSLKSGCLVKAELDASTEGRMGSHAMVMNYTWAVELKDRGLTQVPPGGMTPTGEDVPTK